MADSSFSRRDGRIRSIYGRITEAQVWSANAISTTAIRVRVRAAFQFMHRQSIHRNAAYIGAHISLPEKSIMKVSKKWQWSPLRYRKMLVSRSMSVCIGIEV